jgi:mono/diheme cytochrome c family protein
MHRWSALNPQAAQPVSNGGRRDVPDTYLPTQPCYHSGGVACNIVSVNMISVNIMRPQFSFRLSLRRLAIFSLSALVLIFNGVAVAQAQDNSVAQSKTGGAAGDVARGKYLVEGVAMCGQCHTPRDSQGNPDRTRWLQGGPVPYQSSTPASDWPQMVPRIGGTPPAPDTDMVKLLTTGIWTATGTNLRLPMPQFRMTVADAQAVLAYLKSLSPKQ